jgi:putative serine protease PepD
VAALVASGLTGGITYSLTDRDNGAAPAPEPTSTDTSSQSGDEDLGSGKNTPTIPPDAYDGETVEWNVVAQAVQPTVVSIKAAGTRGESLGSGVIINSEKGYVVTNNHVVADSQQIDVALADGRIFRATALGADPTTDLAVLELQNPPGDLEEAKLGDSSAVTVGEPVMAVGNPLGLDNTATTGIVSALNRPVTTEVAGSANSANSAVVTNAIQVDAAVNPGNSGGPLFNAKGEVIGINSSIATMGSYSGEAGNIGLAFAIPVNLVSDVASQLIDNGVAVHPLLGVTGNNETVEVDGVMRAGALVGQVTPDSPAADAGIQSGDVIIAVDGHGVTSFESLTAWIRSYKPGDTVKLSVARGGSSTDLEATLTTRNDS